MNKISSLSIIDLFNNALAHHQTGNFDDAEDSYKKILALDAQHADSLHLLGVLMHQRRQDPAAADLIGQAIVLRPRVPSYLVSLGNILQHHGRFEEAVTSFRRALALKPNMPEVQFALSDTLQHLGHFEEALLGYRLTLTLNPNMQEAHHNMGVALQHLGRREDAAICLRQALRLKPDFAEACYNLGNVLQELEQLEEAAACYQSAVALKPDFVEAHYNLGGVLTKQGQREAAITSYRRALDLKPDHVEALYNLGNLLVLEDRFREAGQCFRRTLELRPDYPEACNNLGSALQQQGQEEDAIAWFEKALTLKPDHPEAHLNLGMRLLAQGLMPEGWAEFEWRHKIPDLMAEDGAFTHPRWHGEEARHQRLLVHAEYGYGDTLQFCRYGSLAAKRGLRVIMVVPRPLVRLLRSLDGLEAVVGFDEERPSFDLHCPMLSMPLALGTTLNDIPGPHPYLHAEAAQVARWQQRFSQTGLGQTALAERGESVLNVGLVWAGNPRNQRPDLAAIDRRRSINPQHLAPLFNVPGLCFFSLQKHGPPAPSAFPLIDVMQEMTDFADTAALIANLDLVIAVDTAVAHLAAALGKPVWVLNRFDSCWRWLIGRRDSPWYPTLRLYHQSTPGAWDAVMDAVVRDLRLLTNAPNH